MPEPPKSGRPVANDILGYLVRNPEANDTEMGIVEWWLLEQRIERSVAEVREVLADLVAGGLILAEPGPDGQLHYRMNREKESEISRRLRAASQRRRQTE